MYILPTTCMKRDPINVHIRISGYCKQLVKWRALQLSELLQIPFSVNKNIPLKTKKKKERKKKEREREREHWLLFHRT